MTILPDEITKVEAQDDDDIEDPLSTNTKAKVGCCWLTKDFLLYNSSTKLNQAFYLNQFGRAMLFITFMFLSLGVLQLAYKQADCPMTEDGTSYVNCNNKVYGMKPSSMLSLMAIIGGVATSCFMPYAGAVSTTLYIYLPVCVCVCVVSELCLCSYWELFFNIFEFVWLKALYIYIH